MAEEPETMILDKKLFLDAWMTYILTEPFFTLLIGDPVQGIPGLITNTFI